MTNRFKDFKPNCKKLLDYGFSQNNSYYALNKTILNGEFLLSITVDKSNKVYTKLIDVETKEPYTLHLMTNSQGNFVGKIKEEYNKILDDIKENCFDIAIFKSKYTYKVIDYVKSKYNDEPEYLWEKFPDNAIFRRKDTKKWYGAILTVKKSKFGFESDEKIEVLDLRTPNDSFFVKHSKSNIYPGYHMNKKSWISIILDGSVELKEIYKFIDKSYKLAIK